MFCGFISSNVVKRFDWWICFVLWCSKYLFHGFVLSYCAQIIQFLDLFCDAIFKTFDESIKSSWILSTINKQNPSKSFAFGFTNPQVFKRFVLWICYILRVIKIQFADLFCPTVFKRFVSWIYFILLCSKDLVCGFVSE